MAETLELIASCRAAVAAELERTHSPREIRYCQHEIERLDTHPLITGVHKDIYEAVENSIEGITTEALHERFGNRALAAIDYIKQDWIIQELNGRWIAVFPKVEFSGHHHCASPIFICPI
jgi:hypothetical protein